MDAEKQKLNFRFAAAQDAGDFARWAVNHPDIPAKDIVAAMKENNPTSTVLVIENELQQPILYVPLYCAVRIAYLGFNPDADASTRLEAMELMLAAVKLFAASHGINEINTLTKFGYNVAGWARDHGFNPDGRDLYVAQVIPAQEPKLESTEVH